MQFKDDAIKKAPKVVLHLIEANWKSRKFTVIFFYNLKLNNVTDYYMEVGEP